MPSTVELLGKDADSLLKHTVHHDPPRDAPSARPRRRRSHLRPERPQPARARQSPAAHRPRPAARTPATCRSCRSTRASNTRPAHRSPRTRNTSTPRTSSSWPSKAAATRSLDIRRVRHRRPQVRPQDSVHREDQPQRTAHLSEQVRPGDVWHGGRGIRHGCRRRRRHDLLRLRRSDAADRRSGGRVRTTPTSWAWRRSSGATCATPPSRPTRTTTSPPTSPARPITWASRSRPTSSSRSCPRTTAATTRSSSARPRRSSIES